MLNWTDMPAFRHVDLNDSFVLSWKEDGGTLVFEIEASLWPGHPRYTTPPKTDWTCYRKAALIFPRARRVEGMPPMATAPSTTDPDGTIDYGTIDTLQRHEDGSYLLIGDFGEVTIHSEALTFEIL
ncbi:MAG: hypothetical protein ACFCUT_12435 [Kiloniellaceae bacterium]